MALSEGQLQLRDLIFGAGTAHVLVEHFNPFVRTVRAVQSAPRPWRDGSWSGLELAAEAVLPMRIVALATDAPGFVALHQAVAAAFAPSSTDLDLTFVVGGVEYLMRGRPRLVEPSPRRASNICYYQAAFVALDPLIYSSTLHSAALVLPTTSGGLVAPMMAPVTISTTLVAGTKTITNEGTAPAGLTGRMDGPVAEPRLFVQQGSTVQTLRFALTLTSGQWLDVDTLARTVYLNGTVSRRGQAYGDWPLVAPGTSDVEFQAAAYDASAAATVYWRDAWR